MKQVKWFERKFNFLNSQNIFPSIIIRLKGTPILLKHYTKNINTNQLIFKYDNAWSIQENIGHLIDLETVWQDRLSDILNNEKYLRPVDLENTITDLTKHNKKSMTSLLSLFSTVREKTIVSLKNLTTKDITRFALHPRLEQPMRIMDLFLFVAEHDDHHLVRIAEIIEISKGKKN